MFPAVRLSCVLGARPLRAERPEGFPGAIESARFIPFASVYAMNKHCSGRRPRSSDGTACAGGRGGSPQLERFLAPSAAADGDRTLRGEMAGVCGVYRRNPRSGRAFAKQPRG